MEDAPARALESAIAETDSPLLIVADSGTLLAANDAYRHTFGPPPTSLDGLRALSAGLHSARDTAAVAIDLAALLREARPASGIATLRGAQGTSVLTGYSVTPIGQKAPYESAILALQPLESPTLTPEPAFTAVSESAPCLVWVAAPDGSVMFRNRGWAGASDTSSAALNALHPDDVDRCRALWESAVREGVVYEATARHRVGSEYHEFLTRAAPLAAESGEVIAWLGTTTEVGAPGTEAVAEPSQDSAATLAIASHELRAPLAVLRGMAQITRRRADSQQLTSDELREALAMIETQSDHALILVEQLLDHARLGIGKLELSRASCDVTDLVRGIVDRVGAAHEGYTIELRDAGPVHASIDAHRIEQVVMNLLDNAIKFSSPEGRIDVRVVRVVSGATDVAEIAVRDRGRGIPTTERSLIFERFHQVTRDDATKGLGLGLAISREIVELHGGTMSVGTPRGGGARFVVRLPIRQPAEAQDPQGISR